MGKEFVPYEIALELKEIGFDETCITNYYDGELENPTVDTYPNNNKYLAEKHSEFGECISAPLWQQAFRWFREKHNIHVSPNLIEVGDIVYNFTYRIWKRKRLSDPILLFGCATYEEAELICLKRLIEIVKENE